MTAYSLHVLRKYFQYPVWAAHKSFAVPVSIVCTVHSFFIVRTTIECIVPIPRDLRMDVSRLIHPEPLEPACCEKDSQFKSCYKILQDYKIIAKTICYVPCEFLNENSFQFEGILILLSVPLMRKTANHPLHFRKIPGWYHWQGCWHHERLSQ